MHILCAYTDQKLAQQGQKNSKSVLSALPTFRISGLILLLKTFTQDQFVSRFLEQNVWRFLEQFVWRFLASYDLAIRRVLPFRVFLECLVQFMMCVRISLWCITISLWSDVELFFHNILERCATCALCSTFFQMIYISVAAQHICVWINRTPPLLCGQCNRSALVIPYHGCSQQNTLKNVIIMWSM